MKLEIAAGLGAAGWAAAGLAAMLIFSTLFLPKALAAPREFPASDAESAFKAMLKAYWNPEGKFFYKFSDGSGRTDFWWEAQLWDVVMDGVALTGGKKSPYFSLIAQVYDGQAKETPTFTNKFYDDEAWWALAALRAYDITGEDRYLKRAVSLWEDIRHGWSEDLGGGIWWTKDRNAKNACINGPAALMAARLYERTGRAEYLEWSRKIYDWLKSRLVDRTFGLVQDHVSKEGAVDARTYTYNQGTFIGAAVMLYRLTGEPGYLADARRTADATLNFLVDGNDVLKDEGTGDGGGFKMIFVRYLAFLYQVDHTQEHYLEFLRKNAWTAWDEARNEDGLFGTGWGGPPPSGVVESLANGAAVGMLNIVAALE